MTPNNIILKKSRFNPKFYGIWDEQVRELALHGDKEAEEEYTARKSFDSYRDGILGGIDSCCWTFK